MKKRQKRERKKQDRGIVDFMMVTNHFFHSLREWILEIGEILAYHFGWNRSVLTNLKHWTSTAIRCA